MRKTWLPVGLAHVADDDHLLRGRREGLDLVGRPRVDAVLLRVHGLAGVSSFFGFRCRGGTDPLGHRCPRNRSRLHRQRPRTAPGRMRARRANWQRRASAQPDGGILAESADYTYIKRPCLSQRRSPDTDPFRRLPWPPCTPPMRVRTWCSWRIPVWYLSVDRRLPLRRSRNQLGQPSHRYSFRSSRVGLHLHPA